MALELSSRLKHAWNAFSGNRDPTNEYIDYSYPSHIDIGRGYGSRPDRTRFNRVNAKTLVAPIYNRIAMDVAQLTIQHVQLDENDRFIGVVKSGLNECLTVQANADQTARAFIQDVVMSMFDEGCVAIVATETTKDPRKTDAYDVLSLRVGRITQWYPQHVKVEVYNEYIAKKKEIILPKKNVAIVENPLYAIINEPNSTMQRLIRKLSLLDAVDEQTSSGKLDMIIQLPYTIKTDARRQQADKRRKDLEDQLTGSKFGIGYIDGTERVTQLNRPIENNLLKQVEYLTNLGYSQLGITTGVLDGTADEKTQQHYEARIVEPVASAIVDAMKCKFLSKTARTQGKSITCFRDPFKLVTITQFADTIEKFVRDGVVSANEARQKLGMKPSEEPQADALVNSNIAQPEGGPMGPSDPAMAAPMEGSGADQELSAIDDMPISELMNQ